MSGSKTTKQESSPWEPLQPYLKDVVSAGKNVFDTLSDTQFSGQFFADPTARQRSSFENLFSTAAGVGGGWDTARQLAIDTIGGKYLTPDSNPFLADYIDAAIKPIAEKYQFDFAPQLEDAAIGSGAYGGARQDLLKDALAESFVRESGDATGKIAYNNYLNERNNQLAAPNLLSVADTGELAGAESLYNIAGIEQGWDQQKLDEALAQFKEMVSSKTRGLDTYIASLGLGSPYSTTTQTQKTGSGGAILQGLIGAAGLATQLATGGMFPGTAIAGPLAGLFSPNSAITPVGGVW